jgi:acetyltransferase-like isoleucine patch superfamily enzyme
MFRAIRERARWRSTVTPNVHVGPGFRFGQDSFVWAPRKLTIGKNVSLGSRVRIEVDGCIGDAVLIASSVGIVGRDDHQITEIGVPIRDAKWVGRFPTDLSRPVTIGSDVWIGYGATVLSGVTIGDSSVIGAGAVVTRDIPPNSIAVGNPARVVSMRFDAPDFERHWAALAAAGLKRVTP